MVHAKCINWSQTKKKYREQQSHNKENLTINHMVDVNMAQGKLNSQIFWFYWYKHTHNIFLK